MTLSSKLPFLSLHLKQSASFLWEVKVHSLHNVDWQLLGQLPSSSSSVFLKLEQAAQPNEVLLMELYSKKKELHKSACFLQHYTLSANGYSWVLGTYVQRKCVVWTQHIFQVKILCQKSHLQHKAGCVMQALWTAGSIMFWDLDDQIRALPGRWRSTFHILGCERSKFIPCTMLTGSSWVSWALERKQVWQQRCLLNPSLIPEPAAWVQADLHQQFTTAGSSRLLHTVAVYTWIREWVFPYPEETCVTACSAGCSTSHFAITALGE